MPTPACRFRLGSALLAACLLVPALLRAHGGLHDRIAEITELLAQAPDNAGLHFALADILAIHDEAERALAQIVRVEQLAPGRFPTDLVRGRAFATLQRHEEARAALDRLLEIQPTHADALLLRARSLEALGRIDAALADFHALTLHATPTNVAITAEAADAFARHGRADAAVAIIDAALRRDGADPALLRRALALDLAAGRIDAAVQRIDELQRHAPQPEPWMAERARLLTRAGRRDAARTCWDALLAHMAALPNLERGAPAMRQLAEEAAAARAQLGDADTPGS